MTIACTGPDPDLGIAIRLSSYLDCQARALGENGFQALAGGPVAAGLLSGLVTIFVALIGYRLILGTTPALRDGVTWAVRLGVVLALVTSWPAFQTLIYGVAVDSPGQLAATILPAAGLPAEALDDRLQQAYDTIRLGSAYDQQQAADPATQSQVPAGQTAAPQAQPLRSSLAQPPLPQTASVLVISTTGVTAALRIAIGFLLAVGPLAILSLLFDATLEVFSGWIRALAGAALGVLAAKVVTAVDLVMVESELFRLQSYAVGGIAQSVDQQALTTIVLAFGLVMFVTVLTALRMAGAFRLPSLGSPLVATHDARLSPSARQLRTRNDAAASIPSVADRAAQPSRVSTVADALAVTVRREQGLSVMNSREPPSRRASILQAGSRDEPTYATVPLGVAGRRSIGRRSLSAARRDRTA